MSAPNFWRAPIKFLRYASYERPHVVLAFALGLAGPIGILTLYPLREKYLYPDAPLIPLNYPLPSKRNLNLTGFDDPK